MNMLKLYIEFTFDNCLVGLRASWCSGRGAKGWFFVSMFAMLMFLDHNMRPIKHDEGNQENTCIL